MALGMGFAQHRHMQRSSINQLFSVVALIAAVGCILLQARGVALLSAMPLTISSKELFALALASHSSAPKHVKRRDAAPILAHNSFETGVELAAEQPPPQTGTLALSSLPPKRSPLEAMSCSGVRVHLVTEFASPGESLAVIRTSGAERGRPRRVGDPVLDYKVAYIGFNYLKASPAVWLEHDAAVCQILLFEPSRDAPAPPVRTPPVKRPIRTSTLASIERLSETEFRVPRAVLDDVLGNPTRFMTQVRIAPEPGPDGEMLGLRLSGIRPSSLLGAVGLHNGDRLETINGFSLASPEAALAAYARLRSASALRVQLTRAGKPLTLELTIG